MQQYTEKRKLDFTKGMPKICVSITENNLADVISAVQQAQETPADLIEWRLDYFPGDFFSALEMLALEMKLPLLCTLRTKEEGGNASITKREYKKTVTRLIESGLCDYVDIELSAGEIMARRLVEHASQCGIGTVLSKHDFNKTLPQKTLVHIFHKMHRIGADLPKIAVMPNDPEDVLTLLGAALQASREIGPLAAISMGELGKISRAAGGNYGSRLTFSSGKSPSAPGQIPTETLAEIMRTFLCGAE